MAANERGCELQRIVFDSAKVLKELFDKYVHKEELLVLFYELIPSKRVDKNVIEVRGESLDLTLPAPGYFGLIELRVGAHSAPLHNF